MAEPCLGLIVIEVATATGTFQEPYRGEALCTRLSSDRNEANGTGEKVATLRLLEFA
jgi:hypothetical protein